MAICVVFLFKTRHNRGGGGSKSAGEKAEEVEQR